MAKTKGGRPNIRVNETDYERLTGLAETMAARLPEVSEALIAELERATVVEDGLVMYGVVQMGSQVQYRISGGETRDVVLVYPGEADIAAGKISVMTPVGAALVGLSEGQSITFATRDGREHELTVLKVMRPDIADAEVRQPAMSMA